MQQQCPTGMARHDSRSAAQPSVQHRNTAAQLRRGRHKAVHCPDCGGYHVVAISLGAMRRQARRAAYA